MTIPRRAALPLRLPEPLKARLKAYADRTGVSMNAAAVTLLDKALRDEEKR